MTICFRSALILGSLPSVIELSAFEATQLRLFQGQNELPRRDDAGLLPFLGKMAGVSCHEVVGLGCLRTLQKAVVGFVARVCHTRRSYSHLPCRGQGQKRRDL